MRLVKPFQHASVPTNDTQDRFVALHCVRGRYCISCYVYSEEGVVAVDI